MLRSLILPFWKSEERWPAFGMLALVLALAIGSVVIGVRLNEWMGAFWASIEARNEPEFWRQIAIFAGLATLHVLVSTYRVFINQMLQVRWRQWLTEHLTSRWLANKTHYRMSLGIGATENQDQRLSEDIKLLISQTMWLGVGLISEILNLCSFLVILWGLSGEIFGVPHAMVWLAVGYAALGTLGTHLVGRKLAGLIFGQQRAEADYRFALVRVREHSEQIALMNGETSEEARLRRGLGSVVAAWRDVLVRQKKLGFFTLGFNQASVIVAPLMSAPALFSGAINLGGLMQISQAFSQVHGSLSWAVDAYGGIAEWRAAANRLMGFLAGMDAADSHPTRIARINGPRAANDTGPAIIFSAELDNPAGDRLVSRDTFLEIGRGDRILITGPSGVGKSTFLRAATGSWPFGSMATMFPKNEKVVSLPQSPYLIIGTLREVLAYPGDIPSMPAEIVWRARALEALKNVGLHHLWNELNDVSDWSKRLSGGEQQRLAWARMLIADPDWILLDEATSAVDAGTEARMMDSLPSRAGVIAVSHSDTVRPWFNREWRIENGTITEIHAESVAA